MKKLGNLRIFDVSQQNTILNASNSFNHDYPEGGLDGLLQVMECNDVRVYAFTADDIYVVCTSSRNRL